VVHLRSRYPRECAARRRALSVAFLSALPAAVVHRLAEGVRCLFRRTRPRDGGNGGGRRIDADADGVFRRPLRRAPIPDRRHLDDDAVDCGDGARHRVLAGGRASALVGGRQLGHPPGGLRDPEQVGGSRAARTLLRVSHLCRQCRLCRRPAGDGGVGALSAGAARCSSSGCSDCPWC